MSVGLDSLKHIVVLMMENRSFDHMLGGLHAVDARINGLAGNETNPDTTGEPARSKPKPSFSRSSIPIPIITFPRSTNNSSTARPGLPQSPRCRALSKATGISRTT